MADNSNANVLEIRDIHTYIGQFYILQGVSVNVPRGSITVMLGRNGAGKTTTLKSVMGITPPRQGEIIFDGKSLRGMRPFDIAHLGIGFVPEHRAIFKELTVRENLQIAERRKGDLDKRIEFIFEVFPDLKRLYHWPGGNLSGGQQQMLAVARVLVPENRLLLIDEPSEGLAPVIIEQLMHAIQKLSGQTTVLLVEQNFVVARQLANLYTIIEEGHSVHRGDMAALVKDQALIQRYLGAA
jgi:branched-chain amino acid transport system ATP-binding protein